jgi:phenylpropionate dioxygenase-like ring-hydroxylating dioxygenase large terminal subunit
VPGKGVEVGETLNESAARRLLDHLRNNTTDMAPAPLMVPIGNFVSPERAAAERSLLKRLPIVVGHHSELPAPGTFITRTVLDTALLIVRETSGKVAGYLNMCRHRGGMVETSPSGSRRRFMCKYHGWTYDREGGVLSHIPFEDTFGEIDRACFGLIAVQVEERHGLLWADFSNNSARNVEDYLGPEADGQVASFGLGSSVLFLDERIDLPVNWKLVMDGANDILHLKFLHANGVGRLLNTGTSVFERYGRHGQQFSPRKRMEEFAKAGVDVPDVWRYVGSNLRLFPNSMLIAAPDHVEFWTVWPDADPNRCSISIRFLVRAEILDEAMKERITRSWEILRDAALNEDFPMEESIQANSRSFSAGDFCYGRNEVSIQQFHDQLDKDLAEGTGAGPLL